MTELQNLLVSPAQAGLSQALGQRFLAYLAMNSTSKVDVCHVALTGGTVGTEMLEQTLIAVKNQPFKPNWNKIHWWWGDDRFLPSYNSDRNAVQAYAALLDHLPIPKQNIHVIPSSTSSFSTLDAAKTYSAELEEYTTASGPRFNLVLLGLGPDGHIASLFPDHATLHTRSELVVAEENSPKPPPKRISLTIDCLRDTQDIWLMASGTEKAGVVREGYYGFGTLPVRLLTHPESPASTRTVEPRISWNLDQAAASLLD